jgi:hypothetical protein
MDHGWAREVERHRTARRSTNRHAEVQRTPKPHSHMVETVASCCVYGWLANQLLAALQACVGRRWDAPRRSASSICRPETPRMSEATADSLILACSSSFPSRWASRERSRVIAVRARGQVPELPDRLRRHERAPDQTVCATHCSFAGCRWRQGPARWAVLLRAGQSPLEPRLVTVPDGLQTGSEPHPQAASGQPHREPPVGHLGPSLA